MSAKYFCDNCTKEAEVYNLFTNHSMYGSEAAAMKAKGVDAFNLQFCIECLLEFQRKHRQYEPNKVVQVTPEQANPNKKQRKGIFG
jgi:hypothetical protein